jgi:hypothetical protein
MAAGGFLGSDREQARGRSSANPGGAGGPLTGHTRPTLAPYGSKGRGGIFEKTVARGFRRGVPFYLSVAILAF